MTLHQRFFEADILIIEIKSECGATLKKLVKDNDELSKYNWLIKWMDKL